MLFLINMEGWSEITLKVGHIEFSQFILKKALRKD